MHQQHQGQKVTLFDLLSMISFTTPLLMGTMIGFKSGILGILIGLGLGLLFGTASIIGFRNAFRTLAGRGKPGCLMAPVLLVVVFFFIYVPGGLVMFGMLQLIKQQTFPIWDLAMISLLSIFINMLFIRNRFRQK